MMKNWPHPDAIEHKLENTTLLASNNVLSDCKMGCKIHRKVLLKYMRPSILHSSFNGIAGRNNEIWVQIG